LLSEFDTTFGGVLGRLALVTTPDRVIVVTGAWWRGEVAGYDGHTGGRVWRRDDVREVRHLAAAGDGSQVAVSFQRSPMQFLDGLTGETVASARGARAFHASRYAQVGVAEFDGYAAMVMVDPWKVQWRLPIAGFGMLAAAFTPDAVLVSDTTETGSASVYDFTLSGQLLWRYRASPQRNVPWLGRDNKTGDWLGVERDVEHATSDALIRWNSDGELVSSLPLERADEYAFLLGGQFIVASPDKIVDAATGTVAAALVVVDA
jgi:hypothetical protein